MTTPAKSVIRRAAEVLQDPTSRRWKVDMLVRFLNDAQLRLAADRPDSTSTLVPTMLVDGAMQTLPNEAMVLVDVMGNTTSKIAVRKAESALLDAVEPGWQGRAGSKTIKHFIYDLRVPRVFYTYPPALVGAQLDLVYSRFPVVINEPSPGGTWADVAGDLTVADHWYESVLDYVLARAWGVDGEFGGNAALSATHMQRFEQSLVVQGQSATAVAPTS